MPDESEKDRQAKLVIEMVGKTTVIRNPEQPNEEPKKFSFDYSYWSHDGFKTRKDGFLDASSGSKYASQQTVFKDLGKGVLNNAFEGYNCSLFAYGQTGSGKSYSLIGYGANKGIVPITCDELFKAIGANQDKNKRYEVTFSMLEIYNEQVRDLLSKDNPKGGLPVRQSPDLGSFYVQGLKQVPVGSFIEIAKRMEQGTASRTVASTNMNATSSRAHTVVAIQFDQFIKSGNNESKKTSVMNLVDLAGSERADSTGATGDRLKEGANINKSLSALGNVISALADLSTGKKKVMVPYRDSVLTKLLQNALGGNSKTIMIAALSPADINYDETLSTLRYADRAKRIKTKAVINENPVDKLIRELKTENDRLKKMIEGGQVPQPMEEEAKGLTPQGLENLRKQMLEEAMAQLTANQEKIAATEGKGPTWEDKLKMARSESFSLSNDDRKLKEPHLLNLNEDQLLTGVVFHFLTKGNTAVGRKDAKIPPKICLNGLSIQKEHAVISMNANGDVEIRPAASGAKTKVNGCPLTGPRALAHKDRIVFGSSHLYVFINPQKTDAASDSPEQITWEFAQKELAQAKGFATVGASTLSVDHQIVQEQVLEILPMVSEVNAISEELNKYKTFDVVLMTIAGQDGTFGKGTKVMVQMKDLLTENVWLWERAKFVNRRYLMQDVYQAYVDGDQDITKIPKEEDPFWEPVEDALIGTANIFLQSLGYALDFDDSLTITNFKGGDEGTLNVHVSPCTDKGRPLGEEHYVDDPRELVGQPYYFKVTIRGAEMENARYNRGLRIKYSVMGEEQPTETPMSGATLKPQFNHNRVVKFPRVAEEHLAFFETGCISFLVFGKQEDTKPDKKLLKMSTKEVRQMHYLQQKPAMLERRNTAIFTTESNTADPSQLKSELMLQQRKFDRLEYKEKRLQELCREWDAKPDDEKKFQTFYNAVSAVAFSTGTKLKTRAELLTMVLKGHQQVKTGTMNKSPHKSSLRVISEDGSGDDDDTVSVYVFGEDEDQLEKEARQNGGYISYDHLANQYGNTAAHMIESRQRLQQRRQSLVGRRNSVILPMTPPLLSNGQLQKSNSGGDDDSLGSARSSQTCVVQ